MLFSFLSCLSCFLPFCHFTACLKLFNESVHEVNHFGFRWFKVWGHLICVCLCPSILCVYCSLVLCNPALHHLMMCGVVLFYRLHIWITVSTKPPWISWCSFIYPKMLLFLIQWLKISCQCVSAVTVGNCVNAQSVYARRLLLTKNFVCFTILDLVFLSSVSKTKSGISCWEQCPHWIWHSFIIPTDLYSRNPAIQRADEAVLHRW